MEYLIYLLIILFSVTQSAATKFYNKRSDNTEAFNAAKSTSALLLFGVASLFGFTWHIPTLVYGFLYGAALAASMYAGYKALTIGPMALTSMLTAFSVIIPLIYGVAFRAEKLDALKYVAFILLFLAIILTNIDKIGENDKNKFDRKRWTFFITVTFIANGIASVLQKEHQTAYPEQYNSEFMLFAMLLASVIFDLAFFIKNRPSVLKKIKGKRYGVLSGVTNALANFLTLILAGLENATVLFPVISVGKIIAAIFCGRFVFREKLKSNHYAAIVFGIVAVMFLKI